MWVCVYVRVYVLVFLFCLSLPSHPKQHPDLGIRLPLTGAKIPQIGRRGFLGRKTPIFSPTPEKAISSKQKNTTGQYMENGDFVTRNALFWGRGKWVFLTSERSFPAFGDFDPCKGQTDSQHPDLQAIAVPTLPRGPKSWKDSRSPSGIENFKRDWNEWHFKARLKISSEPPTKPLLFVGNSQGQDWKFQATLKFSSEIENFKRKLEIFKRSSEIGFFKFRALWVWDELPMQSHPLVTGVLTWEILGSALGSAPVWVDRVPLGRTTLHAPSPGLFFSHWACDLRPLPWRRK